jgi:hypothetical protein
MKKIFCIHDEKAEAFLQPFFFDTVGQAERALIDCMRDATHNFARYPSDFTLFLIGEFDESSGVITPSKTGLCNLVELLPRVDNVVNIDDHRSGG